MKRVFLIDAMSHIYRAFFAPMGMKQEPLRNSKGQVTQAVFVFTNMLRKLINDEKPEYIAAVFDTSAPTFRHDSFAAYKANRAEMPDDLAAQIPFIVRVCDAFCIPIVKYDGFEADDVIGTLAQEIRKKDMQAVIVSNDKDLCQLVRDPHIIAMRNNSTNVKRKVPVPAVEWCDEVWVKNKFGLPPDKIIDLLGLMGDAVDNIPGAPGIGAVGALKLVLEWGSALNAIENADKITHKTQRESLQNNQAIIKQSLELATIHCEVPVSLDLDALKHCEPDRKLAYDLFRELEFKNLTNEFAGATPGATPLFSGPESAGGLFDTQPSQASNIAVETKYSIIKNRDGLDKLVRRLFEIDRWSYHVNDANCNEKASCFGKEPPLGIGIGLGNGEGFYIDLENFDGGIVAANGPLKDILTNGFLEKSAYDEKRNFGPLLSMGIRPESVKDDVLVAAYLLESTRSTYPIDFLAQVYLDVDAAHTVPGGFNEAAYRTAENADFVARLAPILRQKLRDND
ncbi:MAG: 5'-3' exonuclease H3TH domain-containing protein, partial [Pyrinomonadaceae bacterium]